MENIYNEAIQKVKEGARFRISFEKRSLKIDGKYVIKNGEYEGTLLTPTDSDATISYVEALYNRYRHSIPSERSEGQRKTYFQALPEQELSDEDMFYGERREEAQIKLELYILCAILNGSLKWDEIAKDKWFWQSPRHSSLILLKQWIE